MLLNYENNNVNGLKILIASLFSQNEVKKIKKTGLKDGACLETHAQYGLLTKLNANSAAISLLGKSLSHVEAEWLEWEINFQTAVGTYVIDIVGEKSTKSSEAIVALQLEILNLQLVDQPNFFFKELSAIDIVLYSSLFAFNLNQKCDELLKKYRQVDIYLKFLESNKNFKVAKEKYFGTSNPKLSTIAWNIKTHTQESTNQKSSTASIEKNLNKVSLKSSKKPVSKSIENPTINPQITTEKRKIILPVNGEKNTLITSALPYVNNVPHLGNIIGCVLSADCFSRFCRLRGDNVVYICGTDEYGTATETKALSEGCTPQEICDKYHAIHKSVYDWFNISFDYFGRTTTPSQTIAAQDIFWKLYNNGNITQNDVDQLYCCSCERFLADRFVEGICPQLGCGYEDARGDQCDSCGKLVNATELIKPRCKLCSKTPSLKTSSHLFLNLPKIEPELKSWMNSCSHQWSSNAKTICESWIRDGLKERCITRDLKWGTPVPLDGFKSKVFYVWYDAPIGYISMAMEYSDQWELWFKNPDNVSLYQFMAKDNVPFHGVIFPCSELGSKDNWTKVTHLISTEYLNYEDGKFSKSRGVGIFGDEVKTTGFPSDIWRFYLLYMRPESQDTNFSWTDLQLKNNGELLNNLGNFVNRSLKFVYQFYNGKIPAADPKFIDTKILNSVTEALENYTKCLGACKLKDGIRSILTITKIGNQYIQENEPYKLIKPDKSEEDKLKGATIIHVSINMVALISTILDPYMPDLSNTIKNIMNLSKNFSQLPSKFELLVTEGHEINEPYPLITKITDEKIEELRQRFPASSKQSLDKKSEQKVSEKVLNGVSTGPVEVHPGIIDEALVKELENQVSDQGLKVREVKSSGGSKALINEEVHKLLQLKEKFARAQGIDPATLVKGKKKK